MGKTKKWRKPLGSQEGYKVRLLAWAEAYKNRPLSSGVGLTKFKEDRKHLKYYKNCRDELERMKAHKFNNTTITCFDFLRKSIFVELPGYVRNENVVKELELLTKGHDYEKHYPFYGDFLKQKFNDAVARNKAMEKVCTILSESTRFAGPDFVAFKIIFNYLSERDIDLIVNTPESPTTS